MGKEIDDFISSIHGINEIIEQDELVDTVINSLAEIKSINKLLKIDNITIIDEFTFDYDSKISENIDSNSFDRAEIENLNNEKIITSETLEINRLFNNESSKEKGNELPF